MVPLCQCFHLDSVLLSQCKSHVFLFTFSKGHKVTVLVCFSPSWGALISRGKEGPASCTILQHQRCGAALTPYPKSVHIGITASPSVQAPPTLFIPFPLAPARLRSCREQESDGHPMPRKADQ